MMNLNGEKRDHEKEINDSTSHERRNMMTIESNRFNGQIWVLNNLFSLPELKDLNWTREKKFMIREEPFLLGWYHQFDITEDKRIDAEKTIVLL